MKKHYQLTLLCILLSIVTNAQNWQPVKGHIMTSWGETLDAAKVLPEYPRPQMVRKDWTNLNGLWQYAIIPAGGEQMPAAFQGNILVPFAVESALSGVGKTVGKDSVLWYKRTVNVVNKKNTKTLLHFGAVDWQCIVFLNGTEVGRHQGGYDPFSIDITSALKKGSAQELTVRVWDPSDDGPQPRGKQVKRPHGIWYTPVTGIWQTVWLEAVPVTYITATKQTPDIDQQKLMLNTTVEGAMDGDAIVVTAWDGTNKVAEQTVSPNQEASLSIASPKLWSPSTPFLYDISYQLKRKGKIIDEVKSYFAMRKISMAPDANGIQRMLLNNKFLFQYGPLDQGWWPDGLYTAPTDEALQYDVLKTKEMGFNMIRKHVKVEPARWYYHCDKAGMLVWQDMPSGDLGNHWESRPGIFGSATDKKRTLESEAGYRSEWASIIDALINFPCIVVWVPFNEGWGQFNTKLVTEWTMSADPSRLVNSASGGNFEETGHIMDLHNYPPPVMPDPDLFGKTRILVLGEFGGLGLPIENHTWANKDNWGYQSFKNRDSLFSKYTQFISQIPNLINHGLSAAVYTQTTDVEVEVNGLMTYDRKEIKMAVEKLMEIHRKLYEVAIK